MNDKLTELRTLARDVQAYQLERGLNDSKLCNLVAHLPSTKTYRRLLDEADDLAELSIDNQLNSLRAAVEFIAMRRTKDRAVESEYADFANVVDVRAAVARALSEESVARFVVVVGENGTGKDAAKNSLLQSWSKITLDTEANELWRESLNVPLADVVNAMTIRRRREEDGPKDGFKMPLFPAAKLEIAIEEMSKRKLIWIINEGHHLGPRSINLVKTFINRTPVVPVLFCIPKLLARLVNGAYEEAIQLFGNRLCEQVRLSSPPQNEILLMLERRGVKFTSVVDANAAAQALATEAPSYGNWRYVIQVTREARELSKGKLMDLEQFSKAIGAARSKRVMDQRTNR